MYISRDDMVALCSLSELAQLSNDHMGYGGDSLPDWVVVDTAIAHACELADSYLAGRYELPLDKTPTLLANWCGTIARYWLHGRRINAAEMPKPLQSAYNDALKMLSLVQDGKLHLGIKTLDTPSAGIQSERGAYQVRARAKQDWGGY